jgi:hypothetical protein
MINQIHSQTGPCHALETNALIRVNTFKVGIEQCITRKMGATLDFELTPLINPPKK